MFMPQQEKEFQSRQLDDGISNVGRFQSSTQCDTDLWKSYKSLCRNIETSSATSRSLLCYNVRVHNIPNPCKNIHSINILKNLATARNRQRHPQHSKLKLTQTLLFRSLEQIYNSINERMNLEAPSSHQTKFKN